LTKLEVVAYDANTKETMSKIRQIHFISFFSGFEKWFQNG